MDEAPTDELIPSDRAGTPPVDLDRELVDARALDARARDARDLDDLDDDGLDDGDLDDGDLDDGLDGEVDDGADLDASDESLHIEDEPVDLDREDDLEDEGSTGQVEDCIDAFSEAFNARDLDALLELLADDCEAPGLGNDRANIPDAIEDLWERRPTTILTRGTLDGRSLAVLWEISDRAWWRVAPLYFDDCDEGSIGMIELVDDQEAVGRVDAQIPEAEFEEGATWAEWEDGAES